MPCTTILYDSQLNVPLQHKEIQELLDDVRQFTGKNWQVVPHTVTLGKWPFDRKETWYGLYLHVGGICPWQQINFYRDGSDDLNFTVPLELIAAYLMGTFVKNKE